MTKMQGSIVMVLFLGAAGCASVSTSPAGDSPGQLPDTPITKASNSMNPCTRWKLPLHAHLSHITTSRDGKRILISTSADAKHEGRLRLANASGKVLWMRDLAQPVKAQAISADGALLAINTYDGKLSTYDARTGKKLWEHEHLGRPVIFTKTGRVILLNDDDSEPKTAFSTYDLKGKLITHVAAEHEPLDMDTPDDESFVAITTTDKTLIGYSPDGKLIWQGKLPGDAVAIEAVGGAQTRIFVVSVRPNNKLSQAITAFEPNGQELKTVWTSTLDRKYEAVRVSGETLFLYGNTHFGQAMAAFNTTTGVELWRRSYAAPANYSSLVFASSGDATYMTAALDAGTPAGTLHLMALDITGTARWDAVINASNGLYSYAFAEKAPALIVGAGEPGDGVVQYFEISSKACAKN